MLMDPREESIIPLDPTSVSSARRPTSQLKWYPTATGQSGTWKNHVRYSQVNC